MKTFIEYISEGASVYQKTATKAKSGKTYAFGRDSRLDGRPKEEGGYYVWVLKQNYDGKVRGGIRSSWAYVEKDLSYKDAVKLMNKRLGYKGFDLNESKVEDFLIWEPEGDLRTITEKLNKLKSSKSEVYRGISGAEYNVLTRKGSVKSKGKGNTSDIDGSYVADNVHLAGRFALVAYRDTGEGYLLVLDRKKLPNLEPRDPGNYAVSYIPKDAVKKTIQLSKLK